MSQVPKGNKPHQPPGGPWPLRVDSRGRVTLPRDLLTTMGWRIGDTLLWSIDEQGFVWVQEKLEDHR